MAVSCADPAEHETAIWRLFAFLGRYGKQQAADLLLMSRRDLMMLTTALAGLLEEEGEANRRAANGDG